MAWYMGSAVYTIMSTEESFTPGTVLIYSHNDGFGTSFVLWLSDKSYIDLVDKQLYSFVTTVNAKKSWFKVGWKVLCDA